MTVYTIADTTNLLRLADFIDRPEYEGHFDMETWLQTERYTELDQDLVEHMGDDYAVARAVLNPVTANACGMAACIGGSAEALMLADARTRKSFNSAEVLAWIGLPVDPDSFMWGGEAGQRLFSPGHQLNDGVNALELKDGHRAARVLRHLAATGIIDWSKADRQEGDA